jgi:hypothetical protein
MDGRKMNKILISGLAYPVTAAFEYIVRSFKKIPNWEVKTLGPYFGRYIPWTSKTGQCPMVMPEKYDFKPDIPLPTNQTFMPIRMVENMLGDWKPDIYLDVNAGFYLSGKPNNGIHATFLTDPHCLNYRPLTEYYDYIFNPQTPYLLNTPNEFYIPYGADDDWSEPLNLPKEYDVMCIGNLYPQRIKLFDRLSRMGYKVFFELGIAKMDLPEIFGKSKVCINWASLQDCNARVFESMASGILPIHSRVPDLPKLFTENENYLGFDSEDEAVAKVELALTNNELRNKIILNNMKIRNNLLWDKRVQDMLCQMKLNV